MTSEECPVLLGGVSPVGAGLCEDYGPVQADDIIEEAGGAGDDVSIGSDLSTLVVPFPELAPVVFFCLKQTTCPRSWCIRMVSNLMWLECRISIMVILLNCVTLGMYQPCENIDCTSDRCQILQAFDAFIYIFFALEMVVKMVALGIFGRRCYLGDTWNRLDFFIVMSGMVEYSLDLQNINLSAIRTVRVLRPLKAINRVPSMRILVNLLLDTLPMLGNVLLLCFFVFFIFGIIGVQLWAGLLRNRCYLEENFTLSSGLTLPAPYYQPEEDDERPFICSLAQDNGIMSCGDVPARREGGRTCCLDREDAYHRQSLGAVGLCINWNQYYTRCHTGHSNPHKGAINFDNIVYAWIVIFQVITLEGWVEIMYYVMDAHSFYNFIYFIFLIIIGSFFMINLCLVVIATQFSETKQREHQLMQEQRAQCLSSSTLASLHEPGDCYEELFQLVCHMLRKARRRSVALYNQLRGRPLPPPPTRGRGRGGGRGGGEGGGSANGGERHHLRKRRSCFGHCKDMWDEMRKKLWGIVESKYFNRGIMIAILINTISMGIEHHNQPEELTNVLEISNIVFTSMFTLEMILKLTAFGFFAYLRNPYNIFDGIIVIISVCEIIGQSDGGLSVLRTFRLLRVIKLVRFMPALRRQLVVLMKTMDNVATFCMLLMLFIFIFSILGMHIFGCKFSLKTETGDTVPDRKNFDSLLWAIVTVFQILTQEDWNMVLYNGMASTSPCAALYFVALMTFGNYVLFNLLVAILVEGFQAEVRPEIFHCKWLGWPNGFALPLPLPLSLSLFLFVSLPHPLCPSPFPYFSPSFSLTFSLSVCPSPSLYFSPSFSFSLSFSLSPSPSLYFSSSFSRSLSVFLSLFLPLHLSLSLSLHVFLSLFLPLPLPLCISLPLSPSPSVPLPPCISLPLSPSPSPSLPLLLRISLPLSPSPSVSLPLHLSFSPSLSLRLSFSLAVYLSLFVSLSLPQCRGSSSLYHNWGRPASQTQAMWGRRSSWNSLGRPSRALGLGLGVGGGGSLRSRSPHATNPAEQESLLSPPHPPPHLAHPPPLLALNFVPRRDRRALSLELPELLQVPGTPLASMLPYPRKKSFSSGLVGGGAGGEHQDCNGKAPSAQLQLQLQLPLCFRIQKMMEVYRPEWCETREDWSVFLFSPQNRFRRVCQSIIAYKMFDYVVLAFIFSNCITVALERPKIMQGSLERVFLTISNYVFTAIFVAEMTLKVVSMGLYIGEQAYLKSSWNVLDGFLVFVSLIDIVVSMAGGAKILGVLRVLRLLRTLRPLRVISRAPGLKLVVETLITSLKPIGNIVLICCAFFIIFGILGVQLFKGKFFYCFGPDVKNITNKSDCLQANYKWVHHKYNFDNLGQALMSLFVLASKDGWVNIMYHGLDAVGVDQQPVINNSPWMLLYFISFLLIVSFFVLNMFVGVVVENFHKCRQNQEVEEAKRREDKRRRRMEKKRRDAQKIPYYASYSPLRLWIHTLCTTYYLDLFITFIICINVITMSLEHYSQPRSLDLVLKYCNYFFTSTFVLETLLKLTAFGFRRFFKDRWNQLDLAIVLLSVMGITLEEIDYSASLPINPTIIRIMRVLRIAREQKQFLILFLCVFQVGNLGLLFMLLFFIYAALGVELFGELVCNEDYPCEGMSRHATFENFGMAFLTLFQVSTGDNWNGIMKDTLRECPPDYGPDYSCNPSLQFISPMYFVSFVLTAQFVLINVVVAVLMKHLDDSNKEAKEEAEMDAEIELELATGALCCMGPEGWPLQPAPPAGCALAKTNLNDPTTPIRSQWLDSVSLLIKDSFEGEMLMIDNLSGSVFHHYSSTSPPVWKDCKSHPQLEPFSLSSGGTSCSSTKAGEGSDEGGRGGGGGRVGAASASGSPALIHLPAEFFHPVAAAALPAPPRTVQYTLHILQCSQSNIDSNVVIYYNISLHISTLPLSLCPQYPSHSDSSLATGSSDGSLQTTLEEGLSFSVSPPQDLVSPLPPLPLLCPPPSSGPALTLQATRGHQRSQSSGRGSISPGYNREDSMDPVPCDLEDLGIGISSSIGGCGSSQAGNSEHMSETLSSLSLTSLLSPASLAPPGVKKCNSTGSLNQGARRGEGRQILGLELDHQGFLANPWGESGGGRGEEGQLGGRGEEGQLGEAPGLKGKSSSQTTVGSCSKNR
uniref:Voltage-dependent T-type calcium channel subunit alpha n=1 Tax=Salmo trutta TaxID=8032 RepID=A0A674CJ38_SALTR